MIKLILKDKIKSKEKGNNKDDENKSDNNTENIADKEDNTDDDDSKDTDKDKKNEKNKKKSKNDKYEQKKKKYLEDKEKEKEDKLREKEEKDQQKQNRLDEKEREKEKNRQKQKEKELKKEKEREEKEKEKLNKELDKIKEREEKELEKEKNRIKEREKLEKEHEKRIEKENEKREGRLKAKEELDNYGGQGGAGYFSLKNDKDVATVRFMYNSIDDVEGYAVHEVQHNGKKRYVNCLRSYNEPLDNCPFCANKQFQVAKLFIPVYNEDEGKIQIWERGKKFFAKISSICARYANGTNLVSQMFEIERNGKAGSTQTTYEIYPVGQADSTTLDDLPDLPEILGGLVLDKTADDMNYYLDEGQFPPEDEEEMPVRRRGAREERPERSERRTPARGDRF